MDGPGGQADDRADRVVGLPPSLPLIISQTGRHRHLPQTPTVVSTLQQISLNIALLDKVGCPVIGDFQKCQCHLILKTPHDTKYGNKKEGVCWVPLYGTIMFLHQIPATPTKASNGETEE